VVERVSAPDGQVIEEFSPRVRRRVHVEREYLASIVDGLYGVVNDPNGTAFDARVDGGVPVAGKTGTAQVARRRPREGEDPNRAWYFNRDHAWFAGFAPAGDPEVAVVVLVEHGGGGGRYAAPVAMQIVQEYLGGDEAPTTASAGTGGAATVIARGGTR
jgi:penicillin-binding protein 2